MNKKVLSLVLTLVMVLGTFTSVFAAEEAKKETEKVEKIAGKDNKIQYVIDKKLVEGYEDGSYQLDKTITRAEITKLLVLANGNEELANKLKGAMKVYSDVDNAHWANGFIAVGSTVPSDSNNQAMLQGYPDGTFLPENNVTYAELAKMLVVLAKDNLTADMVKEANANWPTIWLRWAAELGILEDVVVADSNAAATRADAFTMVYNALYTMKNFKRQPADAKLGVLSSLVKDKLVLNQDEKQTYTLTTETVFVQTNESGRSNYIKVSEIKNPDYYLGSLVRVLVNGNNEVTHILELGNPADLALGTSALVEKDNARWAGVADGTAETARTKFETLSKKDTADLLNYAKINLNDAKTSVESISIVNNHADAKAPTVTLDLTDDTRYFVTNPYNNIMKEFDDVDAALAKIGYKNYGSLNEVGYKIPNVYVGFDKSNFHGTALKDYNLNYSAKAKVVVFTVVTKNDIKDTYYRILNASDYQGRWTAEKTDGTVVDRNDFNNLGYFPNTFAGDVWDVVKVTNRNYQNADGIVRVIDHSDTTKFPIVEVVGFEADKDAWVIRDRYNYESLVDVRDADIFNKKQLEEIRVGAKIQFAAEENSTKLDVVSILPYNTPLEGSLRDKVNSVYGATVVAKLLKVNMNGNTSTITVESANNKWNQKDNYGRDFFYVSEDDARALKYYEGQTVVFDTTDRISGFFGKAFADNFRLKDGQGTKILPTATPVEAYKALVANELMKPQDVTAQNVEVAIKQMNLVLASFNELTPDEASNIPLKYTNKVAEVAEAVNKIKPNTFDMTV